MIGFFRVHKYKFLVIILTLIILSLSSVAVYFIYLNKINAKEYSISDIEKAYKDGRNSGNAYREYLDDLFAALQTAVEIDTEDIENLQDVSEYYEDQLTQIEELLEENGADIESLEATKLATLINMKGSLEDLKAVYEQQLEELETRLLEVNETIYELQQLDNEMASQVIGFLYAKEYIESEITKVESVIIQIETQLAEIDLQITELQTEV